MFQVILDLLKSTFKHRKVSIDNSVFRLHYQITFGIVMLFSVIISFTQYVGDPMDCISSTDRITFKEDRETMDMWCYIKGTYIVDNQRLCRPVGAAPGVYTPLKGDRLKFYTYYQWIGLILFAQGLLFYIPHYLWKNWESGHLEMLVGDLYKPGAYLQAAIRIPRVKQISEFLAGNSGNYNAYYGMYAFTEFLNLLNTLLQLFGLNEILGSGFLSFGYDILRYNFKDNSVVVDKTEDFEECGSGYIRDEMNPLDRFFPLVSKCEFKMYGYGGNIETHDSICVPTINAFNQVAYTFIWFWLIMLSTVSAITIGVRILTFVLTPIRLCLLKAKVPQAREDDVRILVNSISVGDWFIMHQLARNLNPIILKDILHNLAEGIYERKNN